MGSDFFQFRPSIEIDYILEFQLDPHSLNFADWVGIQNILGIKSVISFNSILLCKLIMNFSFISVPVLLISGFVLNYLISTFGFTSILSFKLKILLKIYQINYIFVYLCQTKVCKTNIIFKYLLNIIA